MTRRGEPVPTVDYWAMRVFEAFPSVMEACRADWHALPDDLLIRLIEYCQVRDGLAM